jgi:hypothetical protein
MKFSLLQVLCLLISSYTIYGQGKITAKYFSDSKESYIIIIDKKDNIIKGKHCFVFANGERMDCCVDEDFSFRVEKKNKISYEGVLFSCYDDLEYRIRINFEKKHISFHFIGSSHPFVPKELKLYKE